MATTRIMPMHRNEGKTILKSIMDRTNYAMNPDKTDGGSLISSYECDPSTVEVEFFLSKSEYESLTGRESKGTDDVIAYQIRQAFYPGEITPEEANKLGYELAMQFTKGQHAFIVATHVDKAHVHNHIVFNSTTLDCTHKFNNYKGTADVIRSLSDRLCLEHGYSVITEPSEKGKTYAEWNAEKCGNSWKAKLRRTIDAQLPGCRDFDHFLRRMEQAGYEIKRGRIFSSGRPASSGSRMQKSWVMTIRKKRSALRLPDWSRSRQREKKRLRPVRIFHSWSIFRRNFPREKVPATSSGPRSSTSNRRRMP